MTINGELYKQLGRSAAGAVSVIAGRDDLNNRTFALTVSSFVTLSFEPPLVMFALQHSADSYKALVGGNTFGVSLLRSEQTIIALRFARKGADKTDSFSFEWGSVLNVPLVPDALAQIECRTDQVFLCGDHAIVVGHVEEAKIHEGAPLLYFSRQFGSFAPIPS